MAQPLALFGHLGHMTFPQQNSPLEQEEVDIIVTLCQEVS